MANAVFTTKVNPVYDDLPEIRYHFPKTYLNQARQAEGDWIVYYEPRREGADLAGRAGRQVFFAAARMQKIEDDPARSNYYYAHMSDYIEFENPVPFRTPSTYVESALRKEDGSTNKGAFGRSVRILPSGEFQTICNLGFAGSLENHDLSGGSSRVEEEPPPLGRTGKVQLLERPFRDAAFARQIQSNYQATCALTGLRLINGGGRCEIEAAHIRPVADDGPDSPRNGIALSRTVHWMFDRGIISLADDGEILMAKKLVPDQMKRILNPDGQAILPLIPSLKPHRAFLKYHREVKFKGNG